MFDLRNPYINKKHRGGGGRRDTLRYHPDTYYAGGTVQSGGVTGYSGFPTITSSLTEMVAVIPLNTANGTKTITKLNLYMRASVSSGAGVVSIYAVGGTPESAIPTGAILDEDTAFTFTNAALNEVTLDGGDYAPAAGSMLGVRIAYSSGTNFQIGGLMQSVAGARVMWAAAIASPIQDTVWEQFDSFTPGIQVQYSDGSREGFHVGFAASSAGNTPIHGAIASGGCAGIGIQPDEDIAFNLIECFISASGTATSAGVARLYIYDENFNFLWKSVNTYDASVSGTFVTTGRRLKGFEFEDNILERGRKYYIVLAQDASGGSASHHLLLGGSVDAAYVTGGAPPRTFSENGYHGMWSCSSTSGVANLASNVTTGHFMRITRKPLTRTSQVF